MISQVELDRIVDAMAATGVTFLEISGKTTKLRLSRDASAPARPRTNSEPAPTRTALHSPGIGRFQPRGGDDGLAKLDDSTFILAGEVLGYVAQGDVLIPIAAPSPGRLTETRPVEDTLVGYGDILFELETAE